MPKALVKQPLSPLPTWLPLIFLCLCRSGRSMGEHSNLSSGAGKITYTATSPLKVSSQDPGCTCGAKNSHCGIGQQCIWHVICGAKPDHQTVFRDRLAKSIEEIYRAMESHAFYGFNKTGHAWSRYALPALHQAQCGASVGYSTTKRYPILAILCCYAVFVAGGLFARAICVGRQLCAAHHFILGRVIAVIGFDSGSARGPACPTSPGRDHRLLVTQVG